MPDSSDVEMVRLLIGDDNEDDLLFTSEQIQEFLDSRTSSDFVDVYAAAADACSSLANRFAREFDFAEDGQSFSLSQKSAAYRMQARELRTRSGGTSIPLVSSVNTARGDNLPNFGGSVT